MTEWGYLARFWYVSGCWRLDISLRDTDTGLDWIRGADEEIMATQLKYKIIGPIVIPIGILLITALGIVGVGEFVLSVFQGGTKDRFDRPELWLALGGALVILAVLGFVATRPPGTTGILEKDVVLGSRPFYQHDVMTTVQHDVRSGEQGVVTDIAPGYTLYAQSGALATALGQVAGGTDHGKTFAGFIYAKGLAGASSELWIPFEAVMSVYPDTSSAFLSIKGDETEAFGWNVPPESVRRGPSRKPDVL